MPNQVDVPRARAGCPMLAALREGTREQHRAVERELALPRRIRSRADLGAVLAAMLASWQPLEQRLATAADWSALGLDAHLGEAAALLRADLAALDGKPAPGAPAPVTVRLDTLAEAVGGRYVLLGSALGGRLVAPMVERRLGTPPGRATAFFRRAGMDPDRDWQDFRAAVAAPRWTGEQVDQAVRAARDTFAFVGRTASAVLAGRAAG